MVATVKLDLEVIFDNGGGTTVQTNTDYVHHYDDAIQAARDVKQMLTDGNTDGWDGNDPDVWLDTTSAQADDNFWALVQNGGYRHYDLSDIRAEIASTESIEESWRNVSDFLVELTGRKLED